MDLKPQYMLTVINQLNDRPTGAITVLVDIKEQKVGVGPLPGNPHLFPEVVGIIIPLISL